VELLLQIWKSKTRLKQTKSRVDKSITIIWLVGICNRTKKRSH